MKRRDLVKRIHGGAQQHGMVVTESEGGKHTKFYIDGKRVIVPRHNEINEMTAQAILKQCEPIFGKDWWR